MAFIFFDIINKYGNLFVVFCSTCFLKMEAEMATYSHGATIGEVMGQNIDFLVRLQQAVFGLSSLLRVLPKEKFSTVLFPGLIPRCPLSDSIEVLKFLRSPYFLLAGHHLGYSQGYQDLPEDGRMRNELDEGAISKILRDSHLPDQKFFTQIHAEHTGQQADWVAKQIVENDIEAIVLVVASGHMPRAFATLLMSFEKKDHWVPIIPVAHAVNPFAYLTPNMSQDTTEDKGGDYSQFNFVQSELAKVLRYEKDVAQSGLLNSYADWLATHPLLQFNLAEL